MRKLSWSLGLSLMMLCGVPSFAEDAPGASDRAKTLENLMEMAVDRFQLNRYVEARAALNRLIAENPTNEEAFKLRKLFGEKILLEMQRFGDRPVLNEAERKVLQILGEVTYAMDRSHPEIAAEKLDKIVQIYKDAKYADSSFDLKYAEELRDGVKGLNAGSTKEIREYAQKLHALREQLQSIGNVPLILLSRAQAFEQDKLRDPKMVKHIVSASLAGADNAQRNLLELIRLGVYAVPDLLNGLRNDKNDTCHNNAHFILLTLGNRIGLPLCEALKSDNQMFLQQLCAVLGEMRPVEKRAVPYLKAVYDNKKNLQSTIDAAGAALRTITGENPAEMLPAADYFLMAANRYYMGGADVDAELAEIKNTFWVWDPDTVWNSESENGKGALRELPLPSFALSDMMAEELVYRGMETAVDKTPFQVLLGSIFLQQKNRVETLEKLLSREDLTHPETQKLKKDAHDWGKRVEGNQRVVYTLGAKYMTGILEKALRDQKTEVAIHVMDAIALTTGDDGWNAISGYAGAAEKPAAEKPQPVKEGTGASGDEGEAAVAEKEAVKTEEADVKKADVKAESKASPAVAAESHPLLAALDSENPRIAIAAANTLTNIGLPANHPSYKKLLPLLLEGAQENRAMVVEVISGNGELRHRLADELDKGMVTPQVASDGYAGYSLAVQYPPKDAILVDNRLDQFNALRLQMALRNISQNRMLPMTIITTKEHVPSIFNQFAKDEIEQEAKKRRVDVESILTKENNMFTADNWRVVVRHNWDSETKNAFETLQTIMKIDQKQAIVIITCANRDERFKLKEKLQLRAERAMRPESLTEYAKLRGDDKVLGDIFGVRVSYTPVFVDEEIAGYDTMNTVLALQTDPRTRAVPIAVLADNANAAAVRADFDRFIKDNLVRVVSRDIAGPDLMTQVKEMQEKNVLSQKNYARALSNDIATRCALSLRKLSIADMGRSLTPEEEKQLFDVVSDSTRPENLRVAAALALGHFSAQTQVKPLMNLFKDTDKKFSHLRAMIMRAIGQIDVQNAELDFKLAAMGESAEEIQREAAQALGPAAQNQDQLRKYMTTLRPNDPLLLLRNGGKAASEESAENAAAEEKTEAAEEKTESAEESSVKDAAEEEKKDEKKDDTADMEW